MHCQQVHMVALSPTLCFHPITPVRHHNIRSKTPAVSTAAASAGPVLVQDGAVVPAPATAQQLLSEHRGWSYTAALVQQQYDVMDWELHIERLIRNMKVLAEQRPPAYAGFIDWQQQHHKGNAAAVAAALQQLVNPMVATALQQLTHSSGWEADAAAGQPQAMLTVALGDKQPAAKLEPHNFAATAADPAGQPPLSVLVWAKPLPPAASQTAAKVLVAGDPRPAAQAKHCDWVVDRQPLEQLKQQAGVDELLLSDSRGGLLEGLVSNFFVVADTAQTAACAPQPAAACTELQKSTEPAGGANDQQHNQQQQQQEAQQVNPSYTPTQQQQQKHEGQLAGLVLLTAGPSSGDAALLGVTQQRVLQACRHLQLPLVLQPPRGDSTATGAWREAFLTNCVKGLQPVQQVTLADGGVWQLAGPAAITALLRQEVEKLQTRTDMQQWLH